MNAAQQLRRIGMTPANVRVADKQATDFPQHLFQWCPLRYVQKTKRVRFDSNLAIVEML